METVPEVLQLPVVIEGRRPFPRESEVLRNSISSSVASPPRAGSCRNAVSPGSWSNGGSGVRSTNSNFFRDPAASLRFKTISMSNVARSMSQDSISGSKKATQCSIDRLKISVSRNSSASRLSAAAGQPGRCAAVTVVARSDEKRKGPENLEALSA